MLCHLRCSLSHLVLSKLLSLCCSFLAFTAVSLILGNGISNEASRGFLEQAVSPCLSQAACFKPI